MKTIGTKLDNDEFEEFLEICNEEGCSKSEFLRKLVKNSVRERKEIAEADKEIVEEKPTALVTSWKLYDDDGRLIGKSD